MTTVSQKTTTTASVVSLRTAYVKHVTLRAEQGHNLNNLDKGPKDDAKYQISMLYASWFQTRKFFFYVFAI